MAPRRIVPAFLLWGGVAAGVLLGVTFYLGPSRLFKKKEAPTRSELLDLRGRLWSAQQAGVDDPVAHVARDLKDSTAPKRAKPIEDLLHLYAAYRDRARAFANLPMAERFTALKRLRREVFGESLADSLFGEDERMAEFVIRRGEILKDPAFSAEEKKVREERLKHEIFGDEAEEAFPTDWLQYYEKTAKEMVENPEIPAPERERMLDSLREGLFGKEAADRLKKVETEQKEREAREAEIWKGLEGLEADAAMSAEERAKRLSELQGQMPAEDWERLLARFRLHESSLPPPVPK